MVNIELVGTHQALALHTVVCPSLAGSISQTGNFLSKNKHYRLLHFPVKAAAWLKKSNDLLKPTWCGQVAPAWHSGQHPGSTPGWEQTHGIGEQSTRPESHEQMLQPSLHSDLGDEELM